MGLKPKQKQFLLALISSDSVEEACEKVNISRPTAYRYMKDPDFIEARRKAMKELLSSVTSQLQYKATRAVKVLSEIMEDDEAPHYSRVSASKILLERAYKAYEMENIEERIELIEEYIHEQVGGDYE